ncbi:hypothetical protein GCM10007874_12550 [Labrys miyagiensis]|uniref:Uncharacterized protein n=1 Tax=Labrys miyagiensis TaxID=346912 RepID=A0ABQ6CHP2_9HYPH|nr:hypothetical protein [Labrys miyagiensis]GLS18239.1 hypothetical protein GCM10007874_12550 [Labrys miyagiensis]
MNITQMEPMLPEDHRHELADLATDLVSKASALAGRLHPVLQTSIGDLVRSMNCYYSYLIEGHNTRPVDIDRALAGDYAGDPERRNLQLEAVAHIKLQRLIDYGKAPSHAPVQLPAVGNEHGLLLGGLAEDSLQIRSLRLMFPRCRGRAADPA